MERAARRQHCHAERREGYPENLGSSARGNARDVSAALNMTVWGNESATRWLHGVFTSRRVTCDKVPLQTHCEPDRWRPVLRLRLGKQADRSALERRETVGRANGFRHRLADPAADQTETDRHDNYFAGPHHRSSGNRRKRTPDDQRSFGRRSFRSHGQSLNPTDLVLSFRAKADPIVATESIRCTDGHQ